MGLFDLFKKKAAPEPTLTVTAREESAEPKQSSYNRRLKVVGVTFKNEDGSSRQNILKDIYQKKPPFDKRLDIEIAEFEYEGEPAYHVNVNGKTIGNVSRDMCYFITENKSRLLGVSDFKVYEAYRDPETEELIPYSATMKIRVQSKSK